MIQRRSFLTGLTASLFAAPAVVRAASLMPLRGLVLNSFDSDGVRIGTTIRIRMPRDFIIADGPGLSFLDIASPVEEYVVTNVQRSAALQLMAHQ